MAGKLHLHIPRYDELDYRQAILFQPETMNYNRGYELNLSDYNNTTGCIDFPPTKWKDWYNYWIDNEPNRYYAYIAKNEDDAFVGEVNLHLNPNSEWYDMGIVIEGKHRRKAYAIEALKLLLKEAFEVLGAKAVHNDFESIRSAAVKTHLSAGFTKYKEKDGILEFVITEDQYNCSK